MRRLALGIAYCLLASGCATGGRGGGGEVTEYEGVYRHDFEVESFRPCGSPEQWWVANPDVIHARYREQVGGTPGTVFVVMRGELSDPGRYGHMGRYRRMISVSEVTRIEPRDTC
ncbi:MAG TPA: hypothetical protein VHG28_10675 [Longimicrobiaceae bacterium]|nr:hypothetical protein [Longimicrobiaceae bacterium]